MDNPIIRKYLIESTHIGKTVSAVLVGDLHGHVYGQENDALLAKIRLCRPDVIFCTGDMIVAKDSGKTEIARSFMGRLTGIAPVYYVNGNHEMSFEVTEEDRAAYFAFLREQGIHMLRNESEVVSVKGNPMRIYGLEIPSSKYKKFRIPRFSKKEVEMRIGQRDEEAFCVLLAHNPVFVPAYFSWGADLTLCGHNHGGMIRLPSGRSLLSPYGYFLPRFGYGKFVKDGKYAVVTAGLGDHAIPFRVNNPEEIVHLVIKGR